METILDRLRAQVMAENHKNCRFEGKDEWQRSEMIDEIINNMTNVEILTVIGYM